MSNLNSDSAGGADAGRPRSVERLLDSAQAVFAERGYHGANVQEICARAQVGIGTFYASFAHKKDLLRRVMLERAPTLARQLKPDSLDDRDRVTAWITSTVGKGDVGLWRAWRQAVLADDEIAAANDTWRAEVRGEIAKAITAARKAHGTLSAPTEADTVAWTAMTIAREFVIADHAGAPDVRQIAAQIFLLIHG
jgi:AcrR family transcriptional regulator